MPFIHRSLALSLNVLIAVSLYTICPGSTAYAYYDDTHYSFTYYLARCVGYTPTQAYRIASANVMIDHESNVKTEPVQKKRQEDWAQEPRVNFHAFIDERKYSKNGRFFNADKSRYEAGLKDVDAQIEVLWKEAIKYKNPGTYLHAYQDSFAHHGYGSRYGHWKPGLVDETYTSKFYRDWKKKHPPGHFTDYLSWDPPGDGKEPSTKRNFWMATKTAAQLLNYMKAVCPKQFEHARIPEFGKRYNEINKTTQALRSANSFDTGEPSTVVVADASGTDMKKANAVIKVAMSKWGELKKFRTMPKRYHLTATGRPEFLSEWMIWVKVFVKLENLKRDASVLLIMPKTRKNDKSYVIYKKTCTAESPKVAFYKVPVGDVRVKVRDKKTGKVLYNFTSKIRRNRQKVVITLAKGKEKPKPPTPKIGLVGLWSGTVTEAYTHHGKAVSKSSSKAQFRVSSNGTTGYRIIPESPFMKKYLQKSLPLEKKSFKGKTKLVSKTPPFRLSYYLRTGKKERLVLFGGQQVGHLRSVVYSGTFYKK